MKWIDAVKIYYEKQLANKMTTIFDIIDGRISSKKKYIDDVERDISLLKSLKQELEAEIKMDEDKEWKK